LGTNIGTAIAGSTLSNINQTGPGGSTTFTQNGGYTDPTTGQWVPQWNENTSLSPLGNQLLGGQQGLVNSYMPWLQQAGANTGPLDINGGANANIVNQGPQAYDPTVASALYNEQAGFLAPTYRQQQTDLTDQLSRQGMPLGSQGYENAQTQLSNSQNQGYTAAANNATGQGANVAGQNFGLALQGQQQGVNLQQLAQTNPISLLSMLTSGAGMGGSA
jgi:hypothetical protein